MSKQPEISWPSNFVPTEPAQSLPSAKFEHFIQVLDGFGVSFHGWPLDNLWGVVMDSDGHLWPIAYEAKEQLPVDLQVQLNAHVINGHPRALEAEYLFLFALEYLESLADTPGFNDPVALCGRLYGPFPTWPGRSCEPRSCRGRYCVSRADVLEGMIRGAPFVFHGAGAEAHGGTLSRSHHLMLPMGLQDAHSNQTCVTLAYPLPIAMREAADNTTLAAALAYDVLSSLQDDLRRADVCGAFPDLILPVPSRRSLEARLKSKGYEIRGEYAYAPTANPAKSWLGRLFEGLVRERKELPPEAALPEFLRLSKFALDCLNGWPSAQAQALRKQCRVLEAAWPADGFAELTRIVNQDDITVKNGEIVMYCKKDKGANAVFRLPPAFFQHDSPTEHTLDFEVEWFEDAGGGQICYVPAWQENYKIHGTYSLSGSKTWKTATFQIPNARTDGKLWHGDLGVYFHNQGKKPLRIRRAKVIARRPDHLDSKKRRCQGSLDGLGGLDLSKQVQECSLGTCSALPFHGWLVDLGQGTAQGVCSLILNSEQGDWPHGTEVSVNASRRDECPDIVRLFGGAYSMAGFSGVLPLRNMDGWDGQKWHKGGPPPGTYKLRLRLTIGNQYVERELWHLLTLTPPVAEPSPSGQKRQKAGKAAKARQAPRTQSPADASTSTAEPKLASKEPLRVVYFDSNYPCVWLSNPNRIADCLTSKGFHALGADGLALWMKERVTDGAVGSVCVFAHDVGPETVLESQSKDCLLRRYLDAGGRIVWPGDVPLYYRGKRGGVRETWGNLGQHAILGLPAAWTDLRKKKPVVTDMGREYGVTVTGGGSRCQAVKDITSALTLVGDKHAESWFKNFCAAAPLSGFYRLYAGHYPGDDDAANDMLARVAKHKLAVLK